jgi:transcriptional regulator with AAA-type ATPase domain
MADAIPAVCFVQGRGPALRMLSAGGEEDVSVLLDGVLPVAYVVSLEAYARITSHACVDDFGIQNRSGSDNRTVPLGQAFARKGKGLRAIVASYTQPSRLRAGVQSLVDRARREVRESIYIIGAPVALVDPLLRDVGYNEDGNWPAFLANIDVDDALEQQYLGCSEPFVEVRKRIVVASKVERNVLILGDTGTGKEVVARTIHERSDRSGNAFVSLNAAAISPYLFESEIFGCIKGAVPGVPEKTGLWQEAHGGTLFFDEVGSMSLDHQGRVLRALQEGEFRRVGSSEIIKADARIMSATNRDLTTMIARGEFLKDLYYRLEQSIIVTPSLQGHPEDIRLIAQQLWLGDDITKRTREPLPGVVLDLLCAQTYEGNVRQLRNRLMRLHDFLSAEGLTEITVDYFRQAVSRPAFASAPRTPANPMSAYQFECLQALQSASTVIRRAKLALDPFVKRRRRDSRTRKRILSELVEPLQILEDLCTKPYVFHSGDTLQAVSRLKQGVQQMTELLANEPAMAAEHWKTRLRSLYRHATDRVVEEVRSVAGGGE